MVIIWRDKSTHLEGKKQAKAKAEAKELNNEYPSTNLEG